MMIFPNVRIRLSRILGRAGVNASWVIIEKILRIATGVVVGAFVARHLGVEAFGLISYLSALTGLLSPLVGIGLESISVRTFTKGGDLGVAIGSILGLRAISSMIAVFLAPVLVVLVDGWNPQHIAISWIMGWIMFLSISDVFEYAFLAHLRSREVARIRLVSFVFSTFLRVLLVLLDGGVFAFVAIGLIEAIVVGFLLIRQWKGEFPCSLSFDLGLMWSLLREGFPLMVSGFFIMLYMRLDQIMLGALTTPLQVGHFAAALRFSEGWIFLPGAIAASYLPRLMEVRADSALFDQRLQEMYNIIAWVGVLMGLFLMIGAWPLVWVVFGVSFIEAVPILMVLAWTGLWMGLGMARSQHLTAIEATHLHILTTIAGLSVNVVLNLILIPLFGGVGAATATLVAMWVAGHGSSYLIPVMRPSAVMMVRAFGFRSFRGIVGTVAGRWRLS